MTQHENLIQFFLHVVLLTLSRPAASEFNAPNFFDKSISACSLDTATLTNNSKSFALFVFSIIFIIHLSYLMKMF